MGKQNLTVSYGYTSEEVNIDGKVMKHEMRHENEMRYFGTVVTNNEDATREIINQVRRQGGSHLETLAVL